MDRILGHVMTAAGSQVTAQLDAGNLVESSTRIGAMVKIRVSDHDIIGRIGAIQVEAGSPPRNNLVIDLLGTFAPAGGGIFRFIRGVSRYPGAGDPVFAADEADLNAIYKPASGRSIRVGVLDENIQQPAVLAMDELLTKHFSVLGATGSGKSCAVSVILSALLAEHPNAHIVILDSHNEYAAAFGDLAEVLNVNNLQMPFWLLDFEEAVSLLVRGGTAHEQEAQALILKEAMQKARRHSAPAEFAPTSITVDTPLPYMISDLLRFIFDTMGQLEKPDTSVPYLRLRMRIESLRDDRRFAFMFADRLMARDTLSQFVGRILRIPAGGRPVSIVDLSGLPSEIEDVVVSLACRVIFDFVQWSEPRRVPPILLVCEEAHRYAPADDRHGLAAATRAITRIAKEGRKYGISLGLVSQRPSDLSATALSQCGTIFALRMGNETDQRLVRTALPDGSQGLLAALPTLRTREAIVSGEGAPLPMRIRFDDLPPERRPRSEAGRFSEAWGPEAEAPSGEESVLDDGIRRWRLQSRAHGPRTDAAKAASGDDEERATAAKVLRRQGIRRG